MISKKYRILLLLSVVVIAACTHQPEGDTGHKTLTEIKKPIQENKSLENSFPFNVNTTSKENLLTVLNTDVVDELIKIRPVLSLEELFTVLSAQMDSTDAQDLLSKIFVPVNLNSASKEELMLIPGVGEKLAHEFDEYRPYKNMIQFRREIGKYVDDQQVAKYELYVFIPVNLNMASRAEILEIPGVGEKIAHEFEEYRPYKNIEQFKRELGKYVNESELDRLLKYVTI